MNIFEKITDKGLITPPVHMRGNIEYLAMIGSIAYGCSNNTSDIDIYGFSIPNKELIFPESNGYIQGFGRKPQKFEQYQQHGIKYNDKEYDFSIYNIVKYFQLVMDNNPNMIDSLFVPERCILHITDIGKHIRENRHLFLSKKAWISFKGYAYSQLNKCKSKSIVEYVNFCKEYDLDFYNPYMKSLNSENNKKLTELYRKVTQSGKISKRVELIDKYGYDIKFAYHTVRLLNEVEQIMSSGDLDLEQNREQLKSIRRGDWTFSEIEWHFKRKEEELEELYNKCSLPYSAPEDKIKKILLECLEMKFGSLSNINEFYNENYIGISNVRLLNEAIKKIQNVLERT